VGLKRGPLSLVKITEELLERTVAAPVKKPKLTAVGIRCADHATPLYPLKLALTSPTSGGRSVGIVRRRTKPRSFFITEEVDPEDEGDRFLLNVG
jgi:hypothetical protein